MAVPNSGVRMSVSDVSGDFIINGPPPVIDYSSWSTGYAHQVHDRYNDQASQLMHAIERLTREMMDMHNITIRAIDRIQNEIDGLHGEILSMQEDVDWLLEQQGGDK